MNNFYFILFILFLYKCSATEFDIASLHIETLLENSEAFKQLKQRVSLLEERDAEHQLIISKLITDIALQKQTNTKLLETIADLKSRVAADTSTTEDFNHTENYNNGSATLKSKLQKGLSRDETRRVGRGITRRQSSYVAFSAGLTKSMTYGFNQSIIFDYIQTNIGNAYNALKGVFVAPIAGTYVFHASIFTSPDNEVYCRLAINFNKTLNAMVAFGSDGRHGQGTQTTTVELKQNDAISVVTMTTNISMIFSSSDLYTYFTGFLLAADI